MKRFKQYKKLFILTISFSLGSLLTSFTQNYMSSKRFEVLHHPLLNYGSFQVKYDGKNKIPLYTYERLTKAHLEKKAPRNEHRFCQDSKIYSLHKSSTKDYQNSGFDRGHMTPCADQAHSKEALKNTFFLTNICPQNAGLNRGLWSKLEREIRSNIKDDEIMDVITGPLFLPIEQKDKKYIHYEVIGKNNVAVPTHFFKIIKTYDKTLAYVLPNQNLDEKTPLKNFEVSLSFIEKHSGLEFQKK